MNTKKPENNARILTALLDKHGGKVIAESLAVIGWALDKARAEERERIPNKKEVKDAIKKAIRLMFGRATEAVERAMLDLEKELKL